MKRKKSPKRHSPENSAPEGKGHIPLRTCISCGEKAVKKDLIRLALNKEGWVVRDVPGRMPGRGAYVCKSRSCRLGLSKNKRLGRAFRSNRDLTLLPEVGFS
jgi:predicted RNA-binding protein YlxR (DUF448 family)